MVYLHNYINSLDGADGSQSSSARVKICVNSDFTWRALGRFFFSRRPEAFARSHINEAGMDRRMNITGELSHHLHFNITNFALKISLSPQQ